MNSCKIWVFIWRNRRLYLSYSFFYIFVSSFRAERLSRMNKALLKIFKTVVFLSFIATTFAPTLAHAEEIDPQMLLKAV